MTKPEFLYHYTIGAKLRLIAGSGHEGGELQTRGHGAAPGEKPVLWLSANPQWEPTATKVISLDGGRTFMRPSLAQLHAAAGLFRFRVRPRQVVAELESRGIECKLVPWTRIAMVARIQPAAMVDMVQRGLSWGATPMHWWGCMGALPLWLEQSGAMVFEGIGDGAGGGAGGGGGDVAAGRMAWRQMTMSEGIEAFNARGVRVAMGTATEMPAARNL